MRTFFAVILALLPICHANGATLIAPVASSTSGSGATYPFFRVDPMRFQQVYDAVEFVGVLPNGVSITEISFRTGNDSTIIGTTVSNVSVSFSTTSANSSELSTVFSENIGADQKVVFSGRLDFSDNGGVFEHHIFFSSPFVYDPHQGNLLMEVKNLSGTRNAIDPQGTFNPGFAAVNGAAIRARTLLGLSGADAQTGVSFGPSGLLTEFTFTTIPEPSTLWIALFGGCSILILSKLQGRREKHGNFSQITLSKKPLAKSKKYCSNDQ